METKMALRNCLICVFSMVLLFLCQVSLPVNSKEAGGKEKDPALEYKLITPQELDALKSAAQSGLDSRSKEALRHMYTAAALTGLLANDSTRDISKTVDLAKAHGYAMMKAQQGDDTKREARKN